ncbi:uncharacterized protein MYCFIDRAFT_216786 [Pseudocercospora fijiensis CIRAD86]|uniref:Uncharacterized protein n=1 Tax=Pseudocercospora fijiensis (strain CIRAD86) TaxID=383855 RepID=M3AP41_PSEFD|nr:uncharacterized protein MYCFIDRAFT_216786 [Pseudocercospora fijiensis CIRAD86]EME78883.1 hypothetical protein MYCFIDRAFT_216786 [Pseudocercospora fijiensis CIRAD86]
MRTGSAITGLAGLASISSGVTASLPNIIAGCDHICKQRMLYSTLDAGVRFGVDLALDAYNSAKWCASEDSCPATIDSACSMITRRLISGAGHVLRNGDDVDYVNFEAKSFQQATYWGAEWGYRALNRTSEGIDINPVAMKRLKKTLKYFPIMPEGSVVNEEAFEEEMNKPSPAKPAPLMQPRDVAPLTSTTSPSRGACGILPSFTTHYNAQGLNVTIDLCAHSNDAIGTYPTLTSAHSTSMTDSGPVTTTVNSATNGETPTASKSTSEALVTAILPGGSTAIVTALLPAGSPTALPETSDTAAISDSASTSAAATTTRSSLATSSHHATRPSTVNFATTLPAHDPSSQPKSASSSSLEHTAPADPKSVGSSSVASSTQKTAGSSPTGSDPHSSQTSAHPPSAGESYGANDYDEDDEHDDHKLLLGLGVGLGLGVPVVGGVLWALGDHFLVEKTLSAIIKDTVLKGAVWLKSLLQAKDESVDRITQMSAEDAQFLRQPGLRQLDETNYRFERIMQDYVDQDIPDVRARIEDLEGEFNPEQAMTLPDGTLFDNGLRRVFRYERYSPSRGMMESEYVRPADPGNSLNYYLEDYGWRRFVKTTPEGHPVLRNGRPRYTWKRPADLLLIDEDLEWRNVRSRFGRRDADTSNPVFEYLSNPIGTPVGDDLSSQPIIKLNGESIIVDSVGRVQDSLGDTIAAEMLPSANSSPTLRKFLKDIGSKYLLIWDAADGENLQIISKEEFLNRPGNPVLRNPARGSIFGNSIPAAAGTTTKYLSTDYVTRTHHVDFTTLYESTALVTGSMPAPTTLATIRR